MEFLKILSLLIVKEPDAGQLSQQKGTPSPKAGFDAFGEGAGG
jgi:hypothetical protein